MKPTISPITDIKVVDLVLDPRIYCDLLRAPVQQGQLEGAAAEHLAEVLHLAIAQLDAVGDEYGALALATLSDQLDHLQALV